MIRLYIQSIFLTVRLDNGPHSCKAIQGQDARRELVRDMQGNQESLQLQRTPTAQQHATRGASPDTWLLGGATEQVAGLARGLSGWQSLSSTPSARGRTGHAVGDATLAAPHACPAAAAAGASAEGGDAAGGVGGSCGGDGGWGGGEGSACFRR